MTAAPSRPGTPLLVVAGEASGDLHAARLLAELRRERPDLQPFGMGGDELRAAGLEILADSHEVAVVGITEALRVLPRARRVFQRLLAATDERRPPAALLVDFAEFNLRLARQLSRRGVAVAYYVSPQVWAWRRGRVRTIARVVDRMLVLLPFEAGFYRRHGVEVEHVGHPLVDEVPELPQAWDRPRSPGAPFRIVLLPGSRQSEVAALLPAMIAGATAIAATVPVELTLVRAQTVAPAQVARLLAESPLPVRVVDSDRRFAVIADSHLALCASGTATLEVGMLRTPLLVLYRLHRWSYWLGKLMVRLPWWSLVNLVLESAVVPELLQRDTLPERVAGESLRLLTDREARETMRRRLGGLREALGQGGASERAARAVLELLPPPAGAAAPAVEPALAAAEGRG